MESRITRAIQFMMSKGCVRSDEFMDFVQSLRGDRQSQFTEEKVMEAVTNINAKLRKYNMMIRYTLDDKTHERFYSLISTVDNEITRKASHHTDKEFDYFRTILEELQDGPKPIASIRNLSQHLTTSRQRELVEEWAKKHWLVVEDDQIRLGPRTRAELDIVMELDSREPLAGTSRALA